MEEQNQPKPDNRSDNPEKLQNLIHDTQENYREAENYIKAHQDEMSNKEMEQITAKNQRREAAIQGFREEIKDEVNDL